jgi:branched-chain amino acid aminotransferase
MPVTPTPKIWMNGNLVDWDAAMIHVLTPTFHYGTGVYEGIRTYETSDGPAVFRLTDHLERLHKSAKVLNMQVPFSADELVDATKDVVRASGLSSCYIRPIAYYGYGEIGMTAMVGRPAEVAIACWPWGGSMAHAHERGMRLKVSTWVRHDYNTAPPAAKATGNYINNSLARTEAINAGYDEAVMLNRHGNVAECSGENLFCAHDGQLLTPPIAAGALDGITRDTVMTLAGELGISVDVTDLTRTDLYLADEIFTCGTAAEVNGVSSVDDREIPHPGPIGGQIIDEYHRVVHGNAPVHKDWLEYV